MQTHTHPAHPSQAPLYDYIIVGGGSAGCCMAARLSEDQEVSVLLIEAGKRRGGIAVDMPAMVIKLVPPNDKNWNYWTDPQPELKGRKLYWPRGKVMGGSSAINGMLYVRGHPRDYDEWAQLGCHGWSYEDVLPYFIKSQGSDRAGDPLHGTRGPLKTTREDSDNPLNDAFLKAGENIGLPFTPDFNGTDQEGTGWYDRTIAGGVRQSTARTYLAEAEKRPNLHILSESQVTRVLLDGKKAVGVEYVAAGSPKSGEPQQARARLEVILSGGAVNSPQLLQLSGIGDPTDLQAVGIEVRHALPAVGKNLQDHLDALVTAKLNKPLSFRRYESPHRGLYEMAKWFLGRKSALGGNLLPVGAFAKTRTELERPDIQMHIILGYGEKPHGMERGKHHGFGIHMCQLRPQSRGRIYLGSSDPLDSARIDPAYLSDPADLRVMRDGTKMVLTMMRSPALRTYIEAEHAPWKDLDIQDDSAVDETIRQVGETIYHPVGTCAMGPVDQKTSVVDPDLNVIGISGLRIVDASIMPRLIGGNTNAPTIMIAEKIADRIKQARKQKSA